MQLSDFHLTYEFMGVAALGILWVNTFLIVADLAISVGELRARANRLASSQIRKVRILSGLGAGGAFAQLRRSVRGRAFREEEAPSLYWADQPGNETLWCGGEVVDQATGVTRSVTGPRVSSNESEPSVWWGSEAQLHAAVVRDLSARISREESPIRRSKAVTGWNEEIALSVLPSTAPEWFLAVEDVQASSWQATLLSRRDPRVELRSRTAQVAAASVGVFLSSWGISMLALTPPLFEGRSLVGGVLGLVYFLLVQPLGVWARRRALLPGEQVMRFELPILRSSH